MGDVNEIHDQPIGKTWSEDWAAAEEKAAAYHGEQSDKAAAAAGENSDEAQHRSEESLGSGTEEDESGDSEAGSGEGSEQADSSSQSGEESHGGDEQELGGQREVSRDGGLQREQQVLNDSDRLKAVKVEAAALGLEFEGQTILTKERASFREEKRNIRAKLAAERERFENESRDVVARIEENNEKSTRLQTAIEANDLDGIATAMGVESWNHLTEQALKRKLNPEHKELMALRRQKREGELQLEKQKKLAEQQQAQGAQAKARTQYRETIVAQTQKSKKYKQFADDPMFIAGVVKHQEKNWDGEETISVGEASELALKDARLIYDRLHSRFGGQAASQPENQSADGTQSVEKSGRSTPPKTVSHSEVADASGNADDSGEFDEAAWLRKWSTPIKNSVVQT